MFRAEFLARCALAAGVPVTDDMLDWCLKFGYVSRPEKSGGRYRYGDPQIHEMLNHLATRGRQLSPEVRALIARAAEVRRCVHATAGLQTEQEVAQ